MKDTFLILYWKNLLIYKRQNFTISHAINYNLIQYDFDKLNGEEKKK